MTWMDGKIVGESQPSGQTAPSRVIGTPFQPNANGWTLGIYSISFAATHGQSGQVQALCDAANPPTTEAGAVGCSVTDDAAAVTVVTQLVVLCPPGFYVKLVATGTGTPTLVAQQETTIN